MKKGRELLNLPVISRDTGTIEGYVREVKLSPGGQISGLILVGPAQSDQLLFMPLDQITSIGRDAILASAELKPVENAISCQGQCSDTASSCLVMTADGRTLGTLEDVVFEESCGRIVGFELSDGYVKDMLIGRQVVPAAKVITFGSDAVIIEND